MKQFFLKLSTLAIAVLVIQTAVFSQEKSDKKDKKDKMGDYDEIIIKKKGDKDTKVTIEIKDEQIFINGKPISEFDDDNISIRKKDINLEDGQILFKSPRSQFRGGGWNFSSDGFGNSESKTAFLGVTSDAVDGGAKIQEITKGSAAEKAGLKKGDIINKIDEKKIEDHDELTETIHKYKPEDKVTVTFLRDGKEQKLTATLGKMKSASYSVSGFPDMNIYTPPATPYAYSYNFGRPRLGIKAQDTEEGKGVKILDVDDESPAQKAGLKEGDIINQFDGREVNSADALASAARDSKTKNVVKVQITRDGKPQELEIKTPKKLKTTDL